MAREPIRRERANNSADGHREEIRARIRIDEDELDRELREHAEYFERAATSKIEAVALSKTLKVELESLMATLDRDIRARNASEDIKMTETALKSTIQDLPRYQEARQRLLAAEREVDAWDAIKEAFTQRSYMLREINQRQISRAFNLGTERGAGTGLARRIGNQVADRAREAGERSSAERRQRAQERYRGQED